MHWKIYALACKLSTQENKLKYLLETALWGRVFNALGQPLDNYGNLDPDLEYWNIHRPAPALKDIAKN